MQGFAGGKEAAGNYVILDYGGDEEEEVRVAKADYAQKPGEIMFAQSGGGGGWGDPLARDVNAVLQDVLDEYISIDGAARDYGVIIESETMTVDTTATKTLRASLSANPTTQEISPA